MTGDLKTSALAIILLYVAVVLSFGIRSVFNSWMNFLQSTELPLIGKTLSDGKKNLDLMMQLSAVEKMTVMFVSFPSIPCTP